MRISEKMRERLHERRKSMIVTILVAFTLLIACAIAYTSVFYHADTKAIGEYMPEYTVAEHVFDDGSILYLPDEVTAGIIFYPGGKVEHTAYIPLMKALASRGVLTVLVKMPYNLAVLKENAAKVADGIRHYAPKWYIAGHSLGGSMAASYAAKNPTHYDGVILLAAYTTKSLVGSELDVLSIYGSRDTILNMTKYNKYRSNLPNGFDERVISGANHSGFGMYGLQNGDTKGEISTEEQIDQTVTLIMEFIK